MKKTIAWSLILALTMLLSVGATLAFLTDTDEDVNVMTLGQVKIDQFEFERVDDETANEDAVIREFHDNKPLYPAVTEHGFDYIPGDTSVNWDQIGNNGYTSEIWDPAKINNELDKMVFVKNKGDYDTFVRTVFAFEANGYSLSQFLDLFRLNLNEEDWTWEWSETPVQIPNADGSVTTNYIIATATYNHVLKPGAWTQISLSQIALDPKAGNDDVVGFGDTYQILVKSQAIQADGFKSDVLPTYECAKMALDEGFGPVQNNLPFEHDEPSPKLSLKNAMHNEKGNTNKVITSKVTEIVFGRNDQYPNIANHNKGILVEDEQESAVYAYYLEEDDSYTVYFLSDNVIYAPADSSYLFASMTNLKKVVTSNLDVSRVTTMRRLFGGDTKLQEVDVGDWDTSDVTSMNGTFFNCQSLQALDVSNWDVSNVTDMYAFFYNCKNVPELDVSEWDVGQVTNMEFTFCGCNKIVALDVAQWDVQNVTTFNSFFQSADKSNTRMMLECFDAGNWDIQNCEVLDRMFYGCGKLKTVDMSNWDTSKVYDVTSMFFGCKELTTLYASEKWTNAGFTMKSGMFSGCNKLVGGNGTSMSSARVTDGTYARIDTAETPGYLTYKAPNN